MSSVSRRFLKIPRPGLTVKPEHQKRINTENFSPSTPDETNDLQPRFSRIHISLVMWCVLQRAQNYPKMKEPTRERWARRRAGSD